MTKDTETKQRKLPPVKNMLVIGSIILLILAVSASAVYFYIQFKNTQKLLKDPQGRSDEQIQKTIKAVGKLMELPKDETPTFATVSDINKLSSQPFFKNARNGDSVLIYTKAKKAILYRSSENKIIDVAPVNLDTLEKKDSGAQESTTSADVKTPYTVAVYNGTLISGLAKKAEEKIREASLGGEVVEKKDAAKNDYTNNIIVNLGNISVIELEKLKTTFSAELKSDLPEGENKPDADILLILGSMNKSL